MKRTYRIPTLAHTKLFYYDWLINKERYDYNILFSFEIIGDLDVQRMQEAVCKLLEQNLIYKSALLELDNELYWVPSKNENSIIHLNTLAFENEMLTDFDLEQGPLSKFYINKSANKTIFTAIIHHCLIDGNLYDDFLDTLSYLYNNESCVFYPDYRTQVISLEDTFQKTNKFIRENYVFLENFWQNLLKNVEPIDLSFFYKAGFLRLKKNLPCFDKKNFAYIKDNLFNLQDSYLIILNKICQENHYSKFSITISVFALLIHKYSSVKRFAISYPVKTIDNRTINFAASVNTNFIVYDFDKYQTIFDVINFTQEHIKHTKKKGSYLFPINEIMKDKDSSLLNLSFSQTNFKTKKLNLTGLDTRIYDKCNIDLTGDFSFEMMEDAANLNFRVRYYSNIIQQEILEDFINKYLKLYHQIIEDIYQKKTTALRDYCIISKEYSRFLIDLVNDQKFDLNLDETITQIISQNVVLFPNNCAVNYNGKQISYLELYCISSYFDAKLSELGLLQGDRIMILVDKSHILVAALLGILNAGCCYVPLDYRFPQERLKYICQNSDSNCLITEKKYLDKFDFFKGKIILLDNFDFTYSVKIDSKRKINYSTQDLMYVMYTSGTTGNPKGVMVTHRSVVNVIKSFISTYKVGPDDSMLHLGSLAFDDSVIEIFGMLLSGGMIVIDDSELTKNLDTVYIENLINKNNITYMGMTPSLLSNFNKENFNAPSLKVIFSGGEELVSKIISNLVKKYKIVNSYGPTETTVCSSYYEITKDFYKKIPIGKPILGNILYLLDEYLQQVPLGCLGEIYIGGEGVAQGYINDPEKTMEKFLTNPFASYDIKFSNDRIYRTGDIARLLYDGNLEFIDRIDNQIKIRGQRVELSEIQKYIKSYQAIDDAVIITTGDYNNKQLICFYIAELEIADNSITEFLANYLPKYMIPHIFFKVMYFPKTVSGKLNTIELINNYKKFSLNKNLELPKDKDEKAIHNIFSLLLNISDDKFGTEESFFRLGGNSILSIKLMNEINKTYGVTISLAEIFKQKNVRNIAYYLKKSKSFKYEEWTV